MPQPGSRAMARYDVVICGLGITGSAALYAMARRGRRVLGLEQYAAGHDQGSSHGESRIIRLAYFEHPSYVPLVRRAYDLWRGLETEAGRRLLTVTGIVELGRADGSLISGTLAAARQHGIAHQVLPAAEVMARYPAFDLPGDMVGVLQADGGFIAAEDAAATFLDLARRHGAETRFGTAVRAITPMSGKAIVETDHAVIEAETAIIAAGPWLPALAGTLTLPLRVTRQAMAWFAPHDPAPFQLGRFPVFLIESARGLHYGFPAHGEGPHAAAIKVAKHHHAEETVDADRVDRSFTPADEQMIRSVLADFLPAADSAPIDAKTCLYTVSPDGDFIIDRWPGSERVIIASPCSGHGFKFAPAIGEILADLCDGVPTAHDITRFRIARLR